MPYGDYSCPTCEPCATLTLPSVTFDDCQPDSKESEIQTIYMALDADTPLSVDWSDPAAVTTLLGTSLEAWTVIGDLPEPEQAVRTASKRRKIIGAKTFTLNATIDDVNDTNYTAMRNLECGGQYRIWYSTTGGRVYGGSTGVLVNVVKANAPLDRGEDTYERIEVAFEWDAYCHPERTADPFGPLYVAP